MKYIMVEKMETIEYNVFRKPGMHDNSCNFEPTKL